MIFGIHTAMAMKITLLRDMTPCIVVEASRRRGWPYCFHRQIRVDTLIIEVGGSSEMSVRLCQTTGRHTPEDSSLIRYI